MKSKYLYHGSGKRIKLLIPKQARDLRKNKDNSLKGVYASSWKKWAVIMGILGCKGIKRASTHITGKNKIEAVIHSGYPKQTHFYLYVLPSETFRNIPKGGPQWVSFESVKPIRIEKLKVKDYMRLIKQEGLIKSHGPAQNRTAASSTSKKRSTISLQGL